MYVSTVEQITQTYSASVFGAWNPTINADVSLNELDLRTGLYPVPSISFGWPQPSQPLDQKNNPVAWCYHIAGMTFLLCFPYKQFNFSSVKPEYLLLEYAEVCYLASGKCWNDCYSSWEVFSLMFSPYSQKHQMYAELSLITDSCASHPNIQYEYLLYHSSISRFCYILSLSCQYLKITHNTRSH